MIAKDYRRLVGVVSGLAGLTWILTTPRAAASAWTNLAGGNAGGTWGVAANWLGGVPNGTDAVADFSTLSFTADSTVTNDVTRTVGALLFGDTTPGNNWTLTGSALSLAVSSGSPVINVSNQTATLSLALAGSQGFTKTGAGTLVLNSTNSYAGPTLIAGGKLRLPDPPPVPSGVVGFWQFDAAANLGADSSGQGNTLKTATGAPIYGAGKFGGALYLDGGSTMNTLSGAFPIGVPTNNAPYTIAVWEKVDAGCANTGGFVGWGANNTSQANNLRLAGANAINNYWFGNDYQINGLAVNPMDGNWHSVVITWTGATRTFYVDGASVGSQNPVAPNVQGTGFIVGKTTADTNFKGWLDNLLIANRALSIAEIGVYHAGFLNKDILPAGTAVQLTGGGVLDLNNANQSIGTLAGDAGTSVLLGNGVLSVSNASAVVFGGALSGAGAVTKIGAGRLTLSGTNTCTGGLAINAGTLALSAPAGATSIISNTASIAVAGGTVFDVSAVASGFHLASGQTLTGSGTVNGPATVDSGATVRPTAGGSGITTLTFNNPLVLSGSTVLNINRGNTQKADLVVAPSLALGGTITVQNVGAALVLNDTFQLFSVSGTISNAGFFPILPALTGAVHWDYSQLATNGTLKVVSGAQTFFDVRGFGAKGDGVANDYAAINSAIQAAITAGSGSTVYIPGGTYLLNSGQTIVLNNANGLTVQGDTNTLLLTGNMALSDTFSINGSANVTFSMLKMDVTPLRFTQGTITSVNYAAKTCTVAIDSGYPQPDRTDLAAVVDLRVWTDPAGSTWDQNYIPQITTNRLQVSPGVWQLTFTATPKSVILGKKCVLWNYGGGWGFSMNNNTGSILLQDLTWYGGGAGPGYGIWNNFGTVTLRRTSIGIPPGSNRLVASTGGIGVQGNRGAITYDTCDVAYNDDDGTDSGGDLTHVVAKLASAQLLVENGNGHYQVGDTLSVWDWTYMAEHERDRAIITAVVQGTNDVNGATWKLTLDHDVTIINTGPMSPGGDWATIEQDGIDRVCNFNTAASITIRNSRLSSMRARSLLLKSPNSLIESNYFHGSPMPGIQCGTETYWHGGPQLINLTIRGNTFEDIGDPALDLGIFTSNNSFDCTNILIEGNTFINNGQHAPYGTFSPRGCAVRVRNANGVIIRNNVFDNNWAGANIVVQRAKNVQILNNLFKNTHQHYWSDWNNYGVDYSGLIYVDAAQIVTLSGNLVTNMGPYGTRLISMTSTASNLTGTNNGIFLTDQPYSLINGLSSLALDGAGVAGAAATQQTRASSNSRQWRASPVGNGYFTLACLANGLNLGVNNASNSGSALVLESPSGSDEQLWTLVPAGNVNVLLVNKYSGLPATVMTTGAGETVAQQTSAGGLGQQWFPQGAPSEVVATAGYNQVFLSWKLVIGATSYNVKRALASGGTYATIATGITAGSFVDTGLVNGTTYSYEISAITSLGEGPDSMPVSATPSIVGALQTWFKADAITGVVNGATLSAWSDSSGNGFDASAPGAPPTYVTGAINGLPVVRFNSANSTCLTFNRPVQDDFTIMFVYQSSQNNQGTGTAFFQGAGLVDGEQGGVVNDFGTSLNANGRVIGGTGNPDTSIVSGNGFNNGQPHVVTFKRTRSAGAIVLYVDGTQVATGTGGTQSLTAPAQLVLGGVTSGSGYLSGDIAEVQIFNAPIPDSDRIAVENALKCKYGLSGGAAPATPTGLAGSPGNRQVSLTWTPTAGATSYNLYRSADRISYLLLSNAAVSSVVDFSAVSGQTNYYKVAAVDGCGASANSPAVGVLLPLPALGLAANGDSLAISWPAWANDWVLWSTTNLAPPVVWSPVTNAASTANGQFTVSVPFGSGIQFFRLASP
jgi:autotransporter-associated beta strand protein